MRTLGTGLATIPLFLLVVSLSSPAGSGTHDEEIRAALEAAQAAFESGSIPTARFWSARATALLETEDRTNAKTFPLGNASQLLDVLAVYNFVAAGSNPDLDAQAQWLIEQLQTIRMLDESTRKPNSVGDVRIDYAPFTNLVRRMGDLWIDRSPFTQQIRRLGDLAIDYDPFSLEPRRIGGISVDYDPFSGELREVAGVRLH